MLNLLSNWQVYDVKANFAVSRKNIIYTLKNMVERPTIYILFQIFRLNVQKILYVTNTPNVNRNNLSMLSNAEPN